MPHSSGFARLAYEAFYKIVGKRTLYDFINIGILVNDPIVKELVRVCY